MNSGIHFRILRSAADLQSVRESWIQWQQHPHTDFDFFLTIVRIRPEVISPYVIALYRNGVLENLLVGRMEGSHVDVTFGYWKLLRIPVRQLTFVYRGLLGSESDENCAELVRELRACLIREKAQLTGLHFVKVDSSLHRAAREGALSICRDLSECRPHWIMKLPAEISAVYAAMSPKARKNRRYEASRLLKDFDNAVRVACYSDPADVDRVIAEAESIACRTYQRGLGVGFAANAENRERFLIESQRGRFRGYFLYVRDKPIAFFIGTLYKNVLYDNFTAYDPEYTRYSPGMFLFYQVVDGLCRQGVETLDFGFGDAWYKSHFGTHKSAETNICVFAHNLSGAGLKLLLIPTQLADRWGKKAVEKLRVLQSVKKKWRDRAQRRAVTARVAPAIEQRP
jgi:hypothetical protein